MTNMDDLASEFPYKRALIKAVVDICDEDKDAARWILRLFVKAGGPVEMNLACWQLLILAAKEALSHDWNGR